MDANKKNLAVLGGVLIQWPAQSRLKLRLVSERGNMKEKILYCCWMLFFYFLWMYVATVVAIFLQKVMVSASPRRTGSV